LNALQNTAAMFNLKLMLSIDSGLGAG